MLSRQEKEKLVIQLLEEEKSEREISKIVKVNFTFISNVRKKLEGNNSQPSLRIQAYRMFSEGNKPVNVSITLDMPYDETKKLWNQYIELDKGPVILRIINELQNDFKSFVNVYKEMKKNDITIDEMWEGLETSLDIKAKSAHLESLTEAISEAENTYNNLTQQIKEKIDIITRLNSEIMAIRKIKNSLVLQVRFAQDKLGNSFFTNNVTNEIPFQPP